MPSSVKDRFANSYEPVYMLVKNKRYWFDLDAVRIPHQYPDDVARRIRQDKKDGIMPFAKDNKQGIAWRRDLLPKYAKGSKFQQKYGEPWDRFGKNTKKSQKFITPDQSKETQEKTGWQEGSGRIRSFFDNYGGETNPKGKNPGDIWRLPQGRNSP